MGRVVQHVGDELPGRLGRSGSPGPALEAYPVAELGGTRRQELVEFRRSTTHRFYLPASVSTSRSAWEVCRTIPGLVSQ